jgi:phosphohistidine phosphatase
VDLIIWRHAEAEDGMPDLERRLTPKGRKQAVRVALTGRSQAPGLYEIMVVLGKAESLRRLEAGRVKAAS